LNSSKKIIIVEKIVHIAENHVFLEDEETKSNERYVNSKGLSFFVKDWEEHYKELIGIIYRDLKLGKSFSSDYVSNFIDILVSDTLKKGIEFIDENPLEIDIFELKFQKSIAYLPITGMELDINEFKVGKIKFVKLDDEKILLLAKNLAEMDIKNPYFKTPNPKEVLKHAKNEFINYHDKTCATFEIFAENKIALETAKKECENILDLMNFYSHITFSNQDIEIGFDGEVNRFYSRNFSHSKNYFSFYFPMELKGSVHQLRVSDRVIKYMGENGLFKVSKIYEKEKNTLTDFEKTIIMGIHWFADSLKQREIENQFLSLIITLEIF
jgi:hypothetical protein